MACGLVCRTIQSANVKIGIWLPLSGCLSLFSISPIMTSLSDLVLAWLCTYLLFSFGQQFSGILREYVEVSECGWLNIHERREWLSKKTSENHEVAKPPSGFHEFFWITTRVLSEYCHLPSKARHIANILWKARAASCRSFRISTDILNAFRRISDIEINH